MVYKLIWHGINYSQQNELGNQNGLMNFLFPLLPSPYSLLTSLTMTKRITRPGGMGYTWLIKPTIWYIFEPFTKEINHEQ